MYSKILAKLNGTYPDKVVQSPRELAANFETVRKVLHILRNHKDITDILRYDGSVYDYSMTTGVPIQEVKRLLVYAQHIYQSLRYKKPKKYFEL